MGWILVNGIGLPEDDFPFMISHKDAKCGEGMLEDVLEMGCFGTNIREPGKMGIWHSLETGRIIVRQVGRYYQAAPAELTWILPKMVLQNIRKFYKWNKCPVYGQFQRVRGEVDANRTNP